MKQKTPLALLQQWIKENPDGDVLEKIDELKEVERTVITNAHSYGIRFITTDTIIPQPVSEHYFTTNYEQ